MLLVQVLGVLELLEWVVVTLESVQIPLVVGWGVVPFEAVLKLHVLESTVVPS